MGVRQHLRYLGFGRRLDPIFRRLDPIYKSASGQIGEVTMDHINVSIPMDVLRDSSERTVEVFPFQGRYRELLEQSAKLDKIEVTREEFIVMMKATGTNQKEAEFQATVSAGLVGAATKIGDKMVSIKQPGKD